MAGRKSNNRGTSCTGRSCNVMGGGVWSSDGYGVCGRRVREAGRKSNNRRTSCTGRSYRVMSGGV